MSLDKESDYAKPTEIDFDGDIHVGLSLCSEEEAMLILQKGRGYLPELFNIFHLRTGFFGQKIACL